MGTTPVSAIFHSTPCFTASNDAFEGHLYLEVGWLSRTLDHDDVVAVVVHGSTPLSELARPISRTVIREMITSYTTPLRDRMCIGEMV